MIIGLLQQDVSRALSDLERLLRERDYLYDVSVTFSHVTRQAIVRARLQTIDPMDAVLFVEDEVLRELPALFRDLADISTNPISAVPCDI